MDNDRPQLAALGDLLESQRPHLAFDGRMRMSFARDPIKVTSDAPVRRWAIYDALESMIALQRALSPNGAMHGWRTPNENDRP